jgi:hypothetical protein
MRSKRSSTRSANRWALAIVTAWFGFILLSFFLFAMSGCTRYNPALFPSYDVLNPGPEVRLNPIAFTADGNFIVNPAFIVWVDELKNEIIKLRKGK